MKYAALFLYVIVCIIHLRASYADDRTARVRTKPFLLLLLLVYYLLAADPPDGLLVLALFTSWLGDILLIPKGHHWFAYGGISFMFSHLFFVLVYQRQIDLHTVSLPAVLIPALIYTGISLAVILAVKDTTPKKMILPMYFYLLCNSAMNVFAFLQLLSLHTVGAYVSYAGAVLFFISDCTLFLVRYYNKPEIIYRKHFTVMLAYLLGEFLIVEGILLMKG